MMNSWTAPIIEPFTQVDVEIEPTSASSERSSVKLSKAFDVEIKTVVISECSSIKSPNAFDIEKDTAGSGSRIPDKIELDDEVYNKFSTGKKQVIVAIVSFASLLAPFASTSFLPSIPQMSHDLKADPSVINYTIAIFLVTIGVAPLAWSPYSTYYGRQKIYLVSLPSFVAGSIGVGLSQNLVQLIITRIIQGVGASSVLAVGSGSIGDIYKPTERGKGMGLYNTGAILGPSVSPVIAGVVAQYMPGTSGGWRANQFLLAGLGALCFFLVLFFLPETSHTRGMTKLKNPWDLMLKTNSIGVVMISLTSFCVFFANYSVLVPLSSTMGQKFGMTNEALLGTLYLAPGAGSIIGSYLTGYISDSTIKRWIAKRNYYVPEDRLRATFLFGGIVLPLSTLCLGITIQFWTTSGGLVLSLFFFFISGIGLMGVLGVCRTYLVDAIPTRSAEAVATNNFMRYIASASASALALPLIQTIGVALTNAIAAGFSLLGFALIVATVKYGERWREAETLNITVEPSSNSNLDSKK